jgi:hypothetical protein
LEDLATHPTAKPVALVADALKDCSRRGEIVLDPFGGSGTTLLAAEKTGRRARLVEFGPAYCDQMLRRFERASGKRPRLAATAQYFEDIAEERKPKPNRQETASRAISIAVNAGTRSPRQFCLDCIINTPGDDFREAQV